MGDLGIAKVIPLQAFSRVFAPFFAEIGMILSFNRKNAQFLP